MNKGTHVAGTNGCGTCPAARARVFASILCSFAPLRQFRRQREKKNAKMMEEMMNP